MLVTPLPGIIALISVPPPFALPFSPLTWHSKAQNEQIQKVGKETEDRTKSKTNPQAASVALSIILRHTFTATS